jgi:hypothetical protein
MPQQSIMEEKETIPFSHYPRGFFQQQSSMLGIQQGPDFSPLDNVSQLKGDPASTIAGLARWAERAAGIRAENGIDSGQKTMPSFGSFVPDHSRLGHPTPAIKVPFVQESAEIETTLGDSPVVENADTSSDNKGDKQKWPSGAKDGDSILEVEWLDIMKGTDNCLAGLTFLFTGRLKHVSREEGQDLVKRHGGKITFAPSGKIDYVVLGAEAAPTKFAILMERGLKIIDEKGLFDLISSLRGRASSVHDQRKAQGARAKRLNNAAEDTLTAASTLNQQYGCLSTATPGYRPQQQQVQQQQQIIEPPSDSPRGLQARTFLNGFKVFPPVEINFNTPEYMNYKNWVMSTLSRLVAAQENSVSRFQLSHAMITQLESTGLAAAADVISARDTARADLQAAKKMIDAIRNENERNRVAWKSQPVQPHMHKAASAEKRNYMLPLIHRGHHIAAKKSENENMANHDLDHSDRDD